MKKNLCLKTYLKMVRHLDDKVNNGYNIVAGKYFAHVRKLNESSKKF